MARALFSRGNESSRSRAEVVGSLIRSTSTSEDLLEVVDCVQHSRKPHQFERASRHLRPRPDDHNRVRFLLLGHDLNQKPNASAVDKFQVPQIKYYLLVAGREGLLNPPFDMLSGTGIELSSDPDQGETRPG